MRFNVKIIKFNHRIFNNDDLFQNIFLAEI
ncbi:hypothetical protein LCGC14_1492460 [marine sediment metagenome]|uniref:Uncharacterized protein n=1 Tax=marine sediment metagenome TaxID=412755 RepID=A0A0F9M831_9ZZZZ